MGQRITPLAPEGAAFVGLNPGLSAVPDWLVAQAVTTVVSPDRTTLLVLTSGFNKVFWIDTTQAKPALGVGSAEYVFVYDISRGAPVQRQVLPIQVKVDEKTVLTNTYSGVAFDPSGGAFYVSGGSDDVVHVFARDASGMWGAHPNQPLIALGHDGLGVGIPPLDVPGGNKDDPVARVNALVTVKPCAAGLALSDDGRTMVVANYYNDSVSIFWGGLGRWSKWREFDLRPGKSDRSLAGTPGGTYPFWVAVAGNGPYARAYVSSLRDREIIVVDAGVAPRVTGRIKVKGQPLKMTLNRARTRLYVVEDQSDTVDVTDTGTNRIVETIPLVSSSPALPAALAHLTGANPNSLALSPDEKQLWVTFGNLNCVAVVSLDGTTSPSRTIGLIPTGWYPNSVSFGAEGLAPDGKSPMVFVVNGKSPTGPNPGFCYFFGPDPIDALPCLLSNEYNPQLTRAGLQSFPLPGAGQLPALTAQVAVNDRFSSTVSAADAEVLAAVRRGTRHVVFVIKENRAYDQILGDLEVGNGDPELAHFGEHVTPNQHELARRFVTLDNFLCTSETSYDGWLWTTSARAPEVVQRQYPPAYAGRGLSYDSEGSNRAVNVSLATVAERQLANPLMPSDPDLLAGQTNASAPDGPGNEVNTGYLWDAALRAGLSVRNYGFFLDTTRYNLVPGSAHWLPLERDPHGRDLKVAYSASVSLAGVTDPYYRGFDAAFPDYYRFKEWERDFDALYGDGPSSEGRPFPALTLVRLMTDHTGSFSTALDGVNAPEIQVADNDWALGLLVEKISKSRHADDTLIFVIEDDSQDGGDHVDSHRSAPYVIGAHVKRGAVVSAQHNTIDFIRTIEEVLGILPMNLNDALARPMAEIFEKTPRPWTFKASPSAYLCDQAYRSTPQVWPLPACDTVLRPTHDAAYWAEATKGMDFSSEDRFDFARYNRILWKGLAGDRPYPDRPTGLDLRANRKELLER